MIAMGKMRRLMIEPRGAAGLEYGIAGGVLALVFGLLFLRMGPHLADAMASAARSLKIR